MDKVRDIHSIEEIFKDYDFFIFDMDGVIVLIKILYCNSGKEIG